MRLVLDHGKIEKNVIIHLWHWKQIKQGMSSSFWHSLLLPYLYRDQKRVTNITSELVTTISDDFKPFLIVIKLSILVGILDIRLGTLLLMVLYEWCGMQTMLLYLAKPQKHFLMIMVMTLKTLINTWSIKAHLKFIEQHKK